MSVFIKAAPRSEKSENTRLFMFAAIFSAVFLLLAMLYRDFVLDDAFITYRYAFNLAHHGAITWNPSEHPVEGFTSFLWVILNALAIGAKVDPIISSRVISLLSAITIIWVLAFANKTMSQSLVIVFVSAIAVSAPFAFLAMQGMETIFTALLILLSARASTVILLKPSSSHILCWYLFAFLSFLSRPDSAFFSLGVFFVLITILLNVKDYRSLRSFILMAIPWLASFLIYMTWRFHYFGYLFPNSFYIKVASGVANQQRATPGTYESSLNYVASFVYQVLFPYLVLVLLLLLMQPQKVKDRLIQIAPICLGCLFFGLYLLTIVPIQGFLWRFVFPVYPSLLFAAIWYFGNERYEPLQLGNKSLSVILVSLFILWPLGQLPQTLYIKKFRTQFDRVVVGRSLAGIGGTMFVSESGALPYYSGWRAADLYGLTSEEIAHHGLSSKILERVNPDLIMLIVGGAYDAEKEYGIRGAILDKYILDHGFVAVAAIYKSEDGYHYYFVRRSSALFDTIAQRLQNIEHLKYGDLHTLIPGKRIPIWKGE